MSATRYGEHSGNQAETDAKLPRQSGAVGETAEMATEAEAEEAVEAAWAAGRSTARQYHKCEIQTATFD